MLISVSAISLGLENALSVATSGIICPRFRLFIEKWFRFSTCPLCHLYFRSPFWKSIHVSFFLFLSVNSVSKLLELLPIFFVPVFVESLLA